MCKDRQNTGKQYWGSSYAGRSVPDSEIGILKLVKQRWECTAAQDFSDAIGFTTYQGHTLGRTLAYKCVRILHQALLVSGAL